MAAIKTTHLLLVVLTVLCGVAIANVVSSNEEIMEGNRGEGTYKLSFGDRKMAFQDWKTKFRYIHGDYWDDEERFGIFSENVAKIEQHNLLYHTKKSTFYMGLNQFAAMTLDEYQRYNYLGKYSTKKHRSSTRNQEFVKNVHPQSDQKMGSDPEEVDWTEAGYVTPVKDQGQCGSCWIFSAVGSLEGAYFKSHRRLKSFSEQQILDCCSLTNCSTNCLVGGNEEAALQYVHDVHGIETESDYPYLAATTRDCHFDRTKAVGTVQSIIEVTPSGSEDALKSACARNGPISVAIEADLDSFKFYSGGVYDDPNCSSDPDKLDHAVLLTGYATTQDNVDYWIIKNSWSTNWGIQGYIHIVRNKGNSCGVADDGIYPIFY